MLSAIVSLTYHKAHKSHVAWGFEIGWKYGKDHLSRIDHGSFHTVAVKLPQSPSQNDRPPQDVRLHWWNSAASMACQRLPVAPPSLPLLDAQLLAPFHACLPE